MSDFYAILKVSSHVSQNEIRSSYRRLALQVHPDKNTSQSATEQFQLLGQAYATLGDRLKRRDYDANRRIFQAPAPAPTPAPAHPSTGQSEPQNRSSHRYNSADYFGGQSTGSDSGKNHSRNDSNDSWHGYPVFDRWNATGGALLDRRIQNWKLLEAVKYRERLAKWHDERNEILANLACANAELPILESDAQDYYDKFEEMLKACIEMTRHAWRCQGRVYTETFLYKHSEIRTTELMQCHPGNLADLRRNEIQQEITKCKKELKTYDCDFEAQEARTRKSVTTEALRYYVQAEKTLQLPDYVMRSTQSKTSRSQWEKLGGIEDPHLTASLIAEATGCRMNENPWHVLDMPPGFSGLPSCQRCVGSMDIFRHPTRLPAHCTLCRLNICGACNCSLEIIGEYYRWLTNDISDSAFNFTKFELFEIRKSHASTSWQPRPY